jgi:hypothetical protein
VQKHRWRIVIYVGLICLPALLLADPFMRQSLFGPKIDGVPIHAWRHDMRRTFSADRHKPTFAERAYATIGIEHSSNYCTGFWSPPRRDPEMLPILIGLSGDSDEDVRWWVAVYLGDLTDHQEAMASLNFMKNDPAKRVREQAIASLDRAASK